LLLCSQERATAVPTAQTLPEGQKVTVFQLDPQWGLIDQEVRGSTSKRQICFFMTMFVQSDCQSSADAWSKGFRRIVFVTDLGKPGNRSLLLPG
jgi:hypothetical protein